MLEYSSGPVLRGPRFQQVPRQGSMAGNPYDVIQEDSLEKSCYSRVYDKGIKAFGRFPPVAGEVKVGRNRVVTCVRDIPVQVNGKVIIHEVSFTDDRFPGFVFSVSQFLESPYRIVDAGTGNDDVDIGHRSP